MWKTSVIDVDQTLLDIENKYWWFIKEACWLWNLNSFFSNMLTWTRFTMQMRTYCIFQWYLYTWLRISFFFLFFFSYNLLKKFLVIMLLMPINLLSFKKYIKFISKSFPISLGPFSKLLSMLLLLLSWLLQFSLC